jgi:hypothetical protein
MTVRRLALLVALILPIAFSPAMADPAIGSACPTNGQITRSGGAETSGVGAQMVCAGGVWVSTIGYDGSGNASIANAVSVPGDISPTSLSADQNNYAPAGFATASVLRLTSSSAVNITGLAGGSDGRTITIFNIGSSNIVLKNQSTSSTDLNRFAINADFTLGADQSATLIYDSTSQRWRSASIPFSSGGAPCTDDSIATCLLDASRITNDPQFAAGNIISGINILGVTGTYTPGCTIGSAVDSGICGGSINNTDIIVAPSGCAQGAQTSASCSGADLSMNYGNQNANVFNQTYLTNSVIATDLLLASVISDSSTSAYYCRSLALDGKTWHLPSTGELMTIFGNKGTGSWTGASFTSGKYWAANEYNSGQAAAMDFTTGQSDDVITNGNSGYSAYNVRCITYQKNTATSNASCAGPSGCTTVGSVCADGTVFAGCAGDDGHQFFVTPCDGGRTWSGSACTGTATTRYWADSSSSTSSLRATTVTNVENGASNTAALTNGVTNGTGDARTTGGVQAPAAAAYCDTLSINGKTDWYLPARQELAVMYANKTAIGNFASANFWSSSEMWAPMAWKSNFGGTGELVGNKNALSNVRCARHN